jgi:thiol-disulfide isomerase/thioredoxin
MNHKIKSIPVAVALLLIASIASADDKLTVYRVVLASPGGELPFLLYVGERAGGEPGDLVGYIDNGGERIEVSGLRTEGRRIILTIDHYDSRIEMSADRSANLNDGRLPVPAKGHWRKVIGDKKSARLDCTLTASPGYRFKPLTEISADDSLPASVDGRWSASFGDDKTPAIGEFKQLPDGTVHGTFLTTTGDFRYLAGCYQAGRLRMSAFDGGHAFLFDAKMQPDGTLKGDFWSRDSWHETWTAKRDESATLPDGFEMVDTKKKFDVSSLKYRDLDGNMVSLDDPKLRGNARIIEIFGTWCPNCHDASRHLSELQKEYALQGLQVVGLAFEVSGDVGRDTEQIRRFIKRNDVEYPILLGGIADKDTVAKDVPLIDKLRSYPTMIFLDKNDKVRAVYSGYYGPATGEANKKMRDSIVDAIENLLSDAP